MKSGPALLLNHDIERNYEKTLQRHFSYTVYARIRLDNQSDLICLNFNFVNSTISMVFIQRTAINEELFSLYIYVPQIRFT